MFERFGRDAKVAVVLAQEEARELSAGHIGPEHLLIGVLQSAGPALTGVLGGYGLTADSVRASLASGESSDRSFEDDADALRSIGIDLTAVRDNVLRNFGAGAFDKARHTSGRRPRRRGHIPFTRPSKKVLELSMREALLHDDKTIGCEHVLLGILRAGDPEALSLITRHVHATQLRGSVLELLDDVA